MTTREDRKATRPGSPAVKVTGDKLDNFIRSMAAELVDEVRKAISCRRHSDITLTISVIDGSIIRSELVKKKTTKPI